MRVAYSFLRVCCCAAATTCAPSASVFANLKTCIPLHTFENAVTRHYAFHVAHSCATKLTADTRINLCSCKRVCVQSDPFAWLWRPKSTCSPSHRKTNRVWTRLSKTQSIAWVDTASPPTCSSYRHRNPSGFSPLSPALFLLPSPHNQSASSALSLAPFSVPFADVSLPFGGT